MPEVDDQYSRYLRRKDLAPDHFVAGLRVHLRGAESINHVRQMWGQLELNMPVGVQVEECMPAYIDRLVEFLFGLISVEVFVSRRVDVIMNALFDILRKSSLSFIDLFDLSVKQFCQAPETSERIRFSCQEFLVNFSARIGALKRKKMPKSPAFRVSSGRLSQTPRELRQALQQLSSGKVTKEKKRASLEHYAAALAACDLTGDLEQGVEALGRVYAQTLPDADTEHFIDKRRLSFTPETKSRKHINRRLSGRIEELLDNPGLKDQTFEYTTAVKLLNLLKNKRYRCLVTPILSVLQKSSEHSHLRRQSIWVHMQQADIAVNRLGVL